VTLTWAEDFAGSRGTRGRATEEHAREEEEKGKKVVQENKKTWLPFLFNSLLDVFITSS